MADITIISMGPGGKEYLTPQAYEALKQADILIGSDKLKKILYKEFEIFVPTKILEGTKTLINENIEKKIGVLVTGDAGFYSLGKSIIKEFGNDSVRVIAGVSVVQLAFAKKILEPWQDAHFLSVHGRDDSIISEAINLDKFILLCDAKKNSATNMTNKLLELILSHDLYVMENLAGIDERIIQIRSKQDLKDISDASLSVIVGIRR